MMNGFPSGEPSQAVRRKKDYLLIPKLLVELRLEVGWVEIKARHPSLAYHVPATSKTKNHVVLRKVIE